ncbi:hypothetical protein K505DRAFT_361198 [Melanomma pulvis-pyrius CBS 109.77]|uniref:Uncharacterized protein n=1 Tax=Melanomma pulvis-pyrius CBS 109.77 TaxID=1314802 RepID=A0A6A6XF41_9PLEO|nr:hypothetical protein K505DRAFT_361198 [Melanomma pulvis-pyrius CBS 109.77]
MAEEPKCKGIDTISLVNVAGGLLDDEGHVRESEGRVGTEEVAGGGLSDDHVKEPGVIVSPEEVSGDGLPDDHIEEASDSVLVIVPIVKVSLDELLTDEPANPEEGGGIRVPNGIVVVVPDGGLPDDVVVIEGLLDDNVKEALDDVAILPMGEVAPDDVPLDELPEIGVALPKDEIERETEDEAMVTDVGFPDGPVKEASDDVVIVRIDKMALDDVWLEAEATLPKDELVREREEEPIVSDGRFPDDHV